MKKLKTRITAAVLSLVAAIAMVVGLSVPAQAVYGNLVINTSSGGVYIQYDDGRTALMIGPNSRTSNVRAVLLQSGACVKVNAKTWCTSKYQNSVWLIIGGGTTKVARIS